MKITKDNFEAEVMNEKGLTVLDFWASWCGPCKMLAPIFEEIEKETTGVKFGKINVDEEEELAFRFGIQSIPTIVFIKNGENIYTTVGYREKAELSALIEEYK